MSSNEPHHKLDSKYSKAENLGSNVPFRIRKSFMTGKLTKDHHHYEKKNKRKTKDFRRKSNKFDKKNVAPLLSFHSAKLVSEENFDLMQFSDDDSSKTAVCSTNLIDFSDESDSTYEESEKSDLTSEFSIDSGILNNEAKLNALKLDCKGKENFVSVFWDMETCSLPLNKSAVDFANYIRKTFYEGRTEVSFIAVCHKSNLDVFIVNDLCEAGIVLIYRNSLNENKSDKTMRSLLQRFQNEYQNSNSAVVLISDNSDFDDILYEMHNQHQIFINVVCKKDSSNALITAANNFVLFEYIVENLPDHDITHSKQHVLTITNLPNMNYKVIKNTLKKILQEFNCKLKLNSSCAKVFFEDQRNCTEAMIPLKGLYIGGNALIVTYHAQLKENKIISKNKRSKNLSDVNLKETDVPKKEALNSKRQDEINSGNGATLCVIVNTNFQDMDYWKKELEKIWESSEFSINRDSSTLGGCFNITFESLKKAQKAKKILQKNQINDSNSPRFLKLIKHGQHFDILKQNNNNSIENINKKKIDEHLQIIQLKKVKILRNHENVMNEIKCQAKSKVSGATEAVNDKLREGREQMETFENFCDRIVNDLNKFDCNSKNLDQELKELLCDFTRECNCITSALPIYAKKEDILKKIEENQVIVIRAETGSGKSTQLTQYIWRNNRKNKIICTQPRKIAAISLAKHVSSQIGCNLGDTVGFQVGMSSKMSANTSILYVTDFTMLKILVSENMDNVSCIIIDEAHERSIYTDILLGMIKQYLPSHPELRIVITSATIDTSLFRDFFSLTDSAVLHVSGRTFPVHDEWLNHDVVPNWDYFSKTIDKAYEILSEESGDLLSFLTTPLETEKASGSFRNRLKGSKFENNVKVFCLHGKMNAEEQQKVFQNAPHGIRKVVFATNCAETSITIPGIRYVIDCGLVKESKFDPIRNMNILSVGFVSQSSSIQRKGRAGRTQVGKCYHLYSKKNFNCMEVCTVPEILRINLGQALLKLLKIGVKNPLQFDFIQSPPRELLMSAMNQLFCLNAVNENYELTDLGRNMAALPLEPRLCHLIFQGFGNGIGYDAIVTASLITISQTIFFRNSENMNEADKKKKRFCEWENDFLTYLEVYKEWVNLPKSLKSQWCVINCINARSMKTAHELVNEIILILQNELNIEAKPKFNVEPTTYETLTKIIFCSFSQNLSIFSGHSKFGYKNLDISDQLFIHPSSSLYAFGQCLPQFVVYDTILKTTRSFIINVCPIAKDIILDVIKQYNLKVDLKPLEDSVVFELPFYPLGEKTIVNNFIGKKGSKRNELLRKIKEITKSELIEIDLNVSKGSVNVFALTYHFERIRSVVSPIIYSAKQHFLNEERDINLFEDNHFSAVLTAGGLINEIVLPGEFRDIKVILNGQESIESVCEKLSTCGKIVDVREWRRYFKVTFDMPASAKRALDTFIDENDFWLRSINKYSYVNEREYLYKVFMRFYRRQCLGVAFINVEPKLTNLDIPSYITYKDNAVRLSISKKSLDIRVTDLPENTNNEELVPLILSAVPAGTKIVKCVISRKKPYESTKNEIDLIKKNISELFVPYTFKENLTIHLKKATERDIYWNATVYFKNSFDGEAAVNALKSRKIFSNFVGGFILKPHLQTFLCCKTQIFSVVKEEIEKTLEFFKENQSVGNEINIVAVPKHNDIVEIKLSSNNVCDITEARRCISTILNGDELKFPIQSHKMQLFSNSGKEMLKTLAGEFQDSYIYQNEFTKAISIYGKESSCSFIKIRINEFLNNYEDEELRELSLKTNSGKTGVLKELLRTYGYDFQKLKADCGISDIEINKHKQLIIIQGDSKSVNECEAKIQNIKEKLDSNSAEVKGEICPVCCDEVSENRHRLEYCGHIYCVECLLHLFQNSENIPLKCESCQEPIVLIDIFWAIHGRKPLEKILFKRFLDSFATSRSDINYCPSPDCTMIFRVTEDESNIFNCPSCGNNICAKCADLFHPGLTCALNKYLKSNVDASLEFWKKKDPSNRKQCPSCSSPIQKDGGCTHMTCWKCKCHMCWLCLKIFSSGTEVYNHQPYCEKKVRANVM